MPVAILKNALSGPSSAFRIIPAGRFRSIDGRPSPEPAWELTPKRAQEMVALAAAKPEDYVIDFEHQTMNPTGPAPAAGWFTKLEWRPNDGLYVTDARWTDRAKAMLSSREYRYVSPVFFYDKGTGAVNALHSVALTNNPALSGLTDLGAIAINSANMRGIAGGNRMTQKDSAAGAGLTAKQANLLERMTGVAAAELSARSRDDGSAAEPPAKLKDMLARMTGVPYAELKNVTR